MMDPMFCMFDGPENSPGVENVALLDPYTLAPTSDAAPDPTQGTEPDGDQ